MTSEEIKLLLRQCAKLTDGEYNESRSGVPRVIVDLGDCKGSVVYMSRENRWKVFWPFPAREQDKHYEDSLQGMVEYVERRQGGW